MRKRILRGWADFAVGEIGGRGGGGGVGDGGECREAGEQGQVDTAPESDPEYADVYPLSSSRPAVSRISCAASKVSSVRPRMASARSAPGATAGGAQTKPETAGLSRFW